MNGYNPQFSCAKCNGHNFDREFFQVSSSNPMAHQGAQANSLKKFAAITCHKCGYTEFYMLHDDQSSNFSDWRLS